MRYLDYEIVQNPSLLNENQIIVYGYGEDGIYVESILCVVGCNYLICDSNPNLVGKKSKYGATIENPSILEKFDTGIVIIAVRNRRAKIYIEHMLSKKGKFNLVSLFAVECLERFYFKDRFACKTEIMAKQLQMLYKAREKGEEAVSKACYADLLVYQPGKVGSSSVSLGLTAAGIKNFHLHRLFYDNSGWVEQMVGERLKAKSNLFSVEYKNAVKNDIKARKIIVLFRDPVANDLSRIFHIIAKQPGSMLDGYISRKISKGYSFLESLTKSIFNLKNMEFEWFQKELQELTGIDIFSHEFDKEKGYVSIYENGFSVLCMQMEKLDSLESVIAKFVGIESFELLHENTGFEKESKYIYESVKKQILFPKEYLDFYYEGNSQMEHFYSQSDIEKFKRKWCNRL